MLTTPHSGHSDYALVWAFDPGKGKSRIDQADCPNDDSFDWGEFGSFKFPKNKAAKQGVWRLCLRNAFNQVYPHGG
jgi:hypothetical protein